MNIKTLTKKITSPFLDKSSKIDEVFHVQVDSITASTHKNPVIDLTLEYNKDAYMYFQNTDNAEILLVFPNDTTAIKVKKQGSGTDGKIELDLVSKKIADSMSPEQVVDVNDDNYDKWLHKFYSHNAWVPMFMATLDEWVQNKNNKKKL